jgi:hypothetical protein
VNRGGSRNNNAPNCRLANRNNNTPDNRNNNIGWRLRAFFSSLCKSDDTTEQADNRSRKGKEQLKKQT